MGHMRGHFSNGLDDRMRFPQDEHEGRFSFGQKRTPDGGQKGRHGRFSYGEEVLPEDDRVKHVEGHFSDGLETVPR